MSGKVVIIDADGSVREIRRDDCPGGIVRLDVKDGKLVPIGATDDDADKATPTARAKTSGLNIADEIGAKAWGDIRVVIRLDAGITFHHNKKYKTFSWADLGLQNADELRGLLMLLANDGVVNWKNRLSARRDNSLDARRAREQAAGKMRGRVNKLNKKFAAHFPKEWGHAFFNESGVLRHNFKNMETK